MESTRDVRRLIEKEIKRVNLKICVK